MSERLYIALARDPETKDYIVFGVRAETPEEARQLVRKHYREQEWGEPPIYIRVESFRSNAKTPIIQIGHAHSEYVKLEEQIRQLCEKLLDAARWLESEEGSTASYDELRAFVASFEIGAKVMEAYDRVGESSEQPQEQEG